MKSKKILRFYFTAEGVDRALNNLMDAVALGSVNDARGGAECAARLCDIIMIKERLGELWRYLDGVIGGMSREERLLLERYGKMRCGLSRLGEEERRSLRRVAVKFTRHARGVDRFAEGLKLVCKYYALTYTGSG